MAKKIEAIENQLTKNICQCPDLVDKWSDLPNLLGSLVSDLKIIQSCQGAHVTANMVAHHIDNDGVDKITKSTIKNGEYHHPPESLKDTIGTKNRKEV